MGMFDSVYVSCPHCGQSVELQSKAGECCLRRYTLEDAPDEVLIDILNEPAYCGSCKKWLVVLDKAYKRPAPKLFKVKDPTLDKVNVGKHWSWWIGLFDVEEDVVFEDNSGF